jgi:hypothetical protein
MLRLDLCHSRSRPIRIGAKDVGEAGERQAGDVGDVQPRELDGQGLGAQALAVAKWAFGAYHVLRHTPLHQRALRIGEGVQHVALGARERPLIGGLFPAFERAPDLLLRESGIDRNGRLLVREEQPVAVLLGQIPPGSIHVEAERGRDVAQVLAMPGSRPGGDGTLADGQRVVRHHRSFGDLIDPAEAMAPGTGPLRGIGRERLRIEDRLAARIVSGAGIKHAQEVG